MRISDIDSELIEIKNHHGWIDFEAQKGYGFSATLHIEKMVVTMNLSNQGVPPELLFEFNSILAKVITILYIESEEEKQGNN